LRVVYLEPTLGVLTTEIFQFYPQIVAAIRFSYPEAGARWLVGHYSPANEVSVLLSRMLSPEEVSMGEAHQKSPEEILAEFRPFIAELELESGTVSEPASGSGLHLSPVSEVLSPAS
jgi:hypothetical protein